MGEEHLAFCLPILPTEVFRSDKFFPLFVGVGKYLSVSLCKRFVSVFVYLTSMLL